MGARCHNHRLAKIHHNYTVEEVATLYGVHRHTVRNWIKGGLPALKEQRPLLILGIDLYAFLQAKRTKNKSTCLPGEIYCVRCRAPKRPAEAMVDYQHTTEKLGALIGIRPDCHCLMYRRASYAKLDQIRGDLEVRLPQALSHITESPHPSVICDFA